MQRLERGAGEGKSEREGAVAQIGVASVGHDFQGDGLGGEREMVEPNAL